MKGGRLQGLHGVLYSGRTLVAEDIRKIRGKGCLRIKPVDILVLDSHEEIQGREGLRIHSRRPLMLGFVGGLLDGV